MSTHAITKVYDDNNELIITMYKHYDGYVSGYGNELLKFLQNITLRNGITITDIIHEKQFANGIECLAAQLVAYFKETEGDVYLYANYPVSDDEYLYEVTVKGFDMYLSINNNPAQKVKDISYPMAEDY